MSDFKVEVTTKLLEMQNSINDLKKEMKRKGKKVSVCLCNSYITLEKKICVYCRALIGDPAYIH